MIIINKNQKTLFSSFIIVTKSHFKSLVTATKPKPNLYQSVLYQMFSSSDSNRISSIVHLLVVADLGYIKNLFRSRMKNGEVHEYTCNKLLCQICTSYLLSFENATTRSTLQGSFSNILLLSSFTLTSRILKCNKCNKHDLCYISRTL